MPALAYRVQIAVPPETGHIGDRGPPLVLSNQQAQGFFDGRLFGGQTGRRHGFRDQAIVDIDVRSHSDSVGV